MELVLGINTAVTFNTSLAAKEVKTPLDFMPSQWEQKEPPAKRFNRQRFARNVRMALLPFAVPAPDSRNGSKPMK